ncbi:hypothetical protein HanXRQr2_Chr04g0141031 [Helianthus annuus]|uniref:Uncharacterized protein n=1 Tax=Helianthus annuus TaxID=4232 RepID=A0A9K3J482_HELAN|nr:hypothetical protein HanXRQr2_Chr04g0141031 [Helianthus annuus]
MILALNIAPDTCFDVIRSESVGTLGWSRHGRNVEKTIKKKTGTGPNVVRTVLTRFVMVKNKRINYI